MKTFNAGYLHERRNTIVVCRQLRSFQSCFLVTFIAGTNPKVRGGKPCLHRGKEGIPPRPLGVGAIDEEGWLMFLVGGSDGGGGVEGREKGEGGPEMVFYMVCGNGGMPVVAGVFVDR